MGLFLAMSCIVGGQPEAVAQSLSAFVTERKGAFEPANATVDEREEARLLACPAGVTFVYPQDFFEWDAAAEHLSRDLHTAVFSFHIHDGDLWMFLLFVDGEEVAKFNPIPNYWEELTPEEKAKWLPKPEQITLHIPQVQPERIAPYLREWPLDGLTGKANPEDEFEYIDWQVVDFMRQLGFQYPEPGQGITYRFKVKYRR